MRAGGQYVITYVDALECVIGDTPTALALDVAGQVVEYDVSPLPLACDHVIGLGVHKGRIVVSLGIEPAPSAGRRRTTAVLLELPGAKESFGFEVGRVVGFVRVMREDGSETVDGHGSVTTADGRRIRWIDVRRIFGPLAAAGRSHGAALRGAP
jgi:hypothetical protein